MLRVRARIGVYTCVIINFVSILSYSALFWSACRMNLNLPPQLFSTHFDVVFNY